MAFIPAGERPNSLVMGMRDAPDRLRHMASLTSDRPLKLYWVLVMSLSASTS